MTSFRMLVSKWTILISMPEYGYYLGIKRKRRKIPSFKLFERCELHKNIRDKHKKLREFKYTRTNSQLSSFILHLEEKEKKTSGVGGLLGDQENNERQKTWRGVVINLDWVVWLMCVWGAPHTTFPIREQYALFLEVPLRMMHAYLFLIYTWTW